MVGCVRRLYVLPKIVILCLQFWAESIEIWWPSGMHQAFKNVDVDHFYLIEEGKDGLAQQRFGKAGR